MLYTLFLAAVGHLHFFQLPPATLVAPNWVEFSWDEWLEHMVIIGVNAASIALVLHWRQSKANQLKYFESTFNSLIENANDAIFIIDLEYNYVDGNPKALDLLGYTDDELRRLNYSDIVSPDQNRTQTIQKLLAGQSIPIIERRLTTKTGSEIFIEASLTLIRDEYGEPQHVMILVRDITQGKAAKAALTEYKQRYTALFENMENGAALLALGMKIRHANPELCAMLGYTPEEMIGKRWSEFVIPEERDNTYDTYHAIMAGERLPHFQRRLQAKDGRTIIVEKSMTPYRDERDNIAGIQLILRDITHQVQAQQALQSSLTEYHHLAHTDTLTQIPNRRAVRQAGEAALQGAIENRRPFSMLMIDMDHLKITNDTYGHLAGDEALKHIARHMAGNKRNSDHIGRWAGDEFLVILPETEEENAYIAAERLRERIANEKVPRPEGDPIPISISIGVIGISDWDLFLTKPGHALNSNIPDLWRDLLQKADEALYQGKEGGRNKVIIYNMPHDGSQE